VQGDFFKNPPAGCGRRPRKPCLKKFNASRRVYAASIEKEKPLDRFQAEKKQIKVFGVQGDFYKNPPAGCGQSPRKPRPRKPRPQKRCGAVFREKCAYFSVIRSRYSRQSIVMSSNCGASPTNLSISALTAGRISPGVFFEFSAKIFSSLSIP